MIRRRDPIHLKDSLTLLRKNHWPSIMVLLLIAIMLSMAGGIHIGRTHPAANTMQLIDCYKDMGDTICTTPVELGKDEFLKVKIIPVVE